MRSLLSSVADKAQSALNSTSLGRTSSHGNSAQSPDEGTQSTSGSGGILGSRAFESIHHQLRSLQQQYSSSVNPVQKIVTTQKGIALDYDSLSRDAHAQSKELYTWSQGEADDVKDVADRLAWMNYIHGSLAATLAHQMDASRVPFKALRDAENALTPRRNIRLGFENQIARIEHDQQKGMEQKLSEVKKQLRKAELDDEPLEKEVELLKRKAIRESEEIKWKALREYAEKLSLVAQAAPAALSALPTIPPTKGKPYSGAETTASVRLALQQALDKWQVGDSTLLVHQASGADLNRSETRSFGETHAKELARIDSAQPHSKSSIQLTPPATADHTPSHASAHLPPTTIQETKPLSIPAAPSSPKATSPNPATVSPPINPAALNQAPVHIPAKPTSPTPVAPIDPIDPATKVPTVTPTVAETGVPKAAGPEGPGPASGSLHDLKNSPSSPKAAAASPLAGTTWGAADAPGYAGGVVAAAAAPFESAEDEKKRLEREERERLLRQGGSERAPVEPKYESAEEEKRRLEREAREQVLAAGGSTHLNPGRKDTAEGDSDLPPYEEFGGQ